MKTWPWRAGNRVQLLENGEAYFPAVFEAIRNARQEVLIQTFILFEDVVGEELEAAMQQASLAGAKVDLTVDGYGSGKLSKAFIDRMQSIGVTLRMFEPQSPLLGQRINLFRRLHHKLVVIDRRIAFVGGINFSADHLLSSGAKAKRDYAVQVEGPVVQDFRELVLSLSAKRPAPFARWVHRRRRAEPSPAASAAPVVAMAVNRDNQRHFNDIERVYSVAIRLARERIVIANAYFFPGYRLLKELMRAARRGVRVQLILQGNPDMPTVRFITRTLYARLLKAGVEIHEYLERPLHAKVATIDGGWATVGSSNLDPLSLALNLEANLFVADRAFADTLTERLDQLMQHSCKQLERSQFRKPSWFSVLLSVLAYHVSRYFPALIRSLPASPPQNEVLSHPQQVVTDTTEKRR